MKLKLFRLVTRIFVRNLGENAHCGLTVRTPDLVRAAYRGLLGREVDPAGLATYTEMLDNTHDVATFLATIVQSDEFIQSQKRKKSQVGPNPVGTYGSHTLVFLHIQKTAGTSMQNMLCDSYGHKSTYRDNRDSLYLYSPSELSNYSVFAGHFNHDSLAYIPRRQLSIFTFVREPKRRLISLYHYWRSRKPTPHAKGDINIKLANELMMEEFFETSQMIGSPDIWNHMTWVIMGRRQWQAWKTMLTKVGNEGATDEVISTIIRPALCKRLREFIFIGLQDDFERSVDMLFQILKRPPPQTIRADNILEQLVQTNSDFKKNIEKQPMTPRLDAALNRLVQLDNIVYEEASRLYNGRLAGQLTNVSV